MKWISIKDRLPTDNLYYLILIPAEDETRIAKWNPSNNRWIEQINDCHGCVEEYWESRITHRMPLPKEPEDV